MNHDQVMEIADVINYLGNNYATTAAEIAESVNEAASMGQITGVDPKATAAIAASMPGHGRERGRDGHHRQADLHQHQQGQHGDSPSSSRPSRGWA